MRPHQYRQFISYPENVKIDYRTRLNIGIVECLNYLGARLLILRIYKQNLIIAKFLGCNGLINSPVTVGLTYNRLRMENRFNHSLTRQ